MVMMTMMPLTTSLFVSVVLISFIYNVSEGRNIGNISNVTENNLALELSKQAKKSLEMIIYLQRYKNRALKKLAGLRNRLNTEPNKVTPTSVIDSSGGIESKNMSVVTESDFISYSQIPQGVPVQKGVISFVLDTRDKKGPPLQAMNANIWIRVFVRRRRNKHKNRGKKIKLHVLRVQNNTEDTLLTTLMTRVKKTKWQKLDLPINFIQSLLDSKQSVLHLRIMCENCGKRIRPILYKWKKFRRKLGRKIEQRSQVSKEKRRKRRKLRNLSSQDRPPFLVIRTRYAYPVSGYI